MILVEAKIIMIITRTSAFAQALQYIAVLPLVAETCARLADVQRASWNVDHACQPSHGEGLVANDTAGFTTIAESF